METADRKPRSDAGLIEHETADRQAAGETERLEADLKHEHERLLRALSDFENYRRRVERERKAAARSGKRELIVHLLDVLDGFDRALGQMEGAPVSAGVRLLHRNLLRVLEAEGVTPMDSLGASFDPRFHEAIGTVAANELEPGAGAEELQRGYRWGEEVLRPARVRVAQ